MDFTLDQKHEMARTLFKDFAENEAKPLAQETDETEVFPQSTVDKMGKYGFMGIPVPKQYGGQGCDILTYVMCVEELSKVCGTTGVIVSAHTSLCCDPILTYGTEEQKQKYLPPLCNGEKLGAFALTEPGAGTDAQGAQTKAVLDGDEWVLNGSKCFITNGKVADVYIVIAITSVTEDKRGRKKKNFSAFIVEKGTPGFSFGTKEKKMGIRGSSTYELIFEDCRIPKENILGPQGKGFPIAMHTLDGGRIGIAAQALGLAVLGLEVNCQHGTALCKGAAEHTGQYVGIALGGQIVQHQRHGSPVQTEHDQDLPQAAHNSAQQDAVKVCDRIECNAQTIAQQRGDGSDDPQREDKGDAAGDERHKEQLAGIRDELFILLLEPCCKCDGADDGENAGGVVAGSRHNDRDPEQVGDIHAGSGGQVWVQQRCTNGHTLQLRQAELFGGGVGQQHGHKVEETVAQRVQDIVGAAGVAEHADGNEQGDKALYDTGGSQHAQTGGKHCRNDADEGIEQALLFLGGFGAAGGVAVSG